jgi:hypothetical protein
MHDGGVKVLGKHKMNKTVVYCYVLVSLIFSSCGGSTYSKSSPVNSTNQNVQAHQRYNATVTEIRFPQEDYPKELKAAWDQFVADGTYRMAQLEEFTELARNHIDAYGGIYLPLLFDINYDHGYDDFAVIVVNTTKTDDSRFSLVIFSAPEEEGRSFKPSWVLRDQDLSRIALSRASARLVVTEYRSDGTKKSCFVHWHSGQKRYTCD